MAKYKKQEASWLEHCPIPLTEEQINILEKYIAEGPMNLSSDEQEIYFPIWAVDAAETKRTIAICMRKSGTKINGIPGSEIEQCLIKRLPKTSIDDISVYTRLKKLPRRE